MKVRFFLLSSLIAIIPFVDAYAHDNYSEPVIAVPDKGFLTNIQKNTKKPLKNLKNPVSSEEEKLTMLQQSVLKEPVIIGAIWIKDLCMVTENRSDRFWKSPSDKGKL